MGKKMKILALDTAMNGCNVCVYDGQNDVQKSVSVPMSRGQAEALVPLVMEVMKESGVGFDELELVVTTVGPGAFTGLRIGMSAAQSFALALGIPVIGVTTLEILAQQYIQEQSLVSGRIVGVLVETKRSDFYFQLFDGEGRAFSEVQAISAAEIIAQTAHHDVVFVGDAVARFVAGLDIPADFKAECEEILLLDPYVMACIGVARYDAADGEMQGAALVPLYLRPADVSKPKVPPRILEA